jgi:hypothetical protein
LQRGLSALPLVVSIGICATSMAHADALTRGTAAYSRGDYIRAARELSPLAQRGNARALGLLGFLYENGFGEPPSTSSPGAQFREIPSRRPCSD